MPTPKAQLPIVRSFDPKSGTITYHLQNKSHHLPPYDKIHADGIKVRIILKDGTTKHLPDLNIGYELHSFDKFDIVFKKKQQECTSQLT